MAQFCSGMYCHLSPICITNLKACNSLLMLECPNPLLRRCSLNCCNNSGVTSSRKRGFFISSKYRMASLVRNTVLSAFSTDIELISLSLNVFQEIWTCIFSLTASLRRMSSSYFRLATSLFLVCREIRRLLPVTSR